MALLAAVLGRRLDVPVFFDMAENYPAALVAYNKSLYKPLLFGNGWLPKQYEKLSLRYMAHVFVVADEQLERLAAAGFDRGKISVVMNTPDLDFYLDRARQESGSRSDPTRPTLLYVGKIDAHRGIELVVRAMPRVAGRYPQVRLLIVGDGSERQNLVELASSLRVAHNVELPGWLAFEHVPALIAQSTVCLIPHLKSEHTETTVPNKIFDYMALGKPVVVSDCSPLARIVREADCGRVFRSGDVGDLGDQVLELLGDSRRDLLGANRKRKVAERYHWARDAERFLVRMKLGAA
jgi:glycosyltransferase involved in cell wall biosynthesis